MISLDSRIALTVALVSACASASVNRPEEKRAKPGDIVETLPDDEKTDTDGDDDFMEVRPAGNLVCLVVEIGKIEERIFIDHSYDVIDLRVVAPEEVKGVRYFIRPGKEPQWKDEGKKYLVTIDLDEILREEKDGIWIRWNAVKFLKRMHKVKSIKKKRKNYK